jgi:hypothetical protein
MSARALLPAMVRSRSLHRILSGPSVAMLSFEGSFGTGDGTQSRLTIDGISQYREVYT